MARSRLAHLTLLLALCLAISGVVNAERGWAVGADRRDVGAHRAAVGADRGSVGTFRPSQGDSDLSFVGQLGGGSLAVEATENVAYVGAGPSVHVLDTATLGPPRVLGRSEAFGDVVYDLALNSDVLLAATGADGLRVLDARDTAKLATLSVITTSAPAKGIAVSADRAFVVSPGAGISVLSLTDGAMTRLAEWPAPQLTGPIDVSSTGLVVALADQGWVAIDARAGMSVTIGGPFAHVAHGLDFDDCTNHLALAGEPGLILFDLADPAHPVTLGFWDGAGATAVHLACDRAYVATSTGGVVLDLTDPTAPEELASFPLAGWAAGLAHAGTRLMAAVNRGVYGTNDPYSLAGGLDVFELPPDAAPARRSLYEIPSGQLRDIDATGTTVLATEGDPAKLLPGRAWSFDVSDPSRPLPSGSADLEGDPYRAAAKPPFGMFTSSMGFLVTTTGADGRLRAFKRTAGLRLGDADLTISGARMYTIGGPENLAIYDVGYPPDVTKLTLALVPDVRGATSIDVENGLAFAGGENGAVVLDVREPVEPRSLSRLHNSGPVADVAAFGRFALTADRVDGVRTIDATELLHIGVVGHKSGPGLVSVAAEGGAAFTVDVLGVVEILDLTDPRQPRVAGRVEAPGLARLPTGNPVPFAGAELASVGDVGLVAHPSRGLMVYRADRHVGPTPTPVRDPDLVYLPAISNKSPVSPARFTLEQVGRQGPVNTRTWALDVAGDLAYVGRTVGNDHTITVVNVRDPAEPFEVGRSDELDGVPTRLVFRDGLVYAATGTGGLYVVDVSDSPSPAVIGRLTLGREFTQIALADDGKTVYLINALAGQGTSHLVVVDVSNPREPVERGGVAVGTGSPATGIAVLGGFVYVSVAAGTIVVDVANPAAPEIVGSFGLADAMEPAVARHAWPSMRNLVAVVNRGSESLPGGLWLLDVADPRAVREAGTLVSIDWPEVQGARQVSWLGSRLLAATEDDLHLYDVSDPRSPQSLADLNDQYVDIWEVLLTETRVYLTDGDKGLVIMALVPDRAGALPYAVTFADTP